MADTRCPGWERGAACCCGLMMLPAARRGGSAFAPCCVWRGWRACGAPARGQVGRRSAGPAGGARTLDSSAGITCTPGGQQQQQQCRAARVSGMSQPSGVRPHARRRVGCLWSLGAALWPPFHTACLIAFARRAVQSGARRLCGEVPHACTHAGMQDGRWRARRWLSGGVYVFDSVPG